MAFKPANANNKSTGSGEIDYGPRPVPKSGSRKARVSLIVDLGVQEREDVYELDGKAVSPDTEGATCKPQKPCQQVAVFADLVADTVDYGGNIGKQHYRLMLNNSFAGKLKGINFTATPPKDAKGNMIAGKPWGFHPANLLTKLAKAVGKPEVVESMDVDELLGLPFMATVEVKEKDSGKLDKDGNPIIYKNVNYKGATEVPCDDDDEPIKVAELNVEAKSITFDNAKAEDVKFLRKNIVEQIKLAKNYAGSQMQKAIEEFEAEKPAEQSAPAPAAKPSKPASKKQEEPEEDDSNQSPF